MSSDLGRFHTLEETPKVLDDRCIMHENDLLHRAIAAKVSGVYGAETTQTLAYLWR